MFAKKKSPALPKGRKKTSKKRNKAGIDGSPRGLEGHGTLCVLDPFASVGARGGRTSNPAGLQRPPHAACDSIVRVVTDSGRCLGSSVKRHAPRAIAARSGGKNLHMLPFDVSMSVCNRPMFIAGASICLRQIKEIRQYAAIFGCRNPFDLTNSGWARCALSTRFRQL